jgi:hypothetical protein
MDDRRFDLVVTAIGGAMTRRAGLRAVIAGSVAAFAGAVAANVDAGAGAGGKNERDGKSGRRPRPEGPCGKTPQDNQCKSGKDCCTGVCNRKNNKCRCVKRNKSCTEDRNCCNSLRCTAGVCSRGGGDAGIATGQPCQAGQSCKDAAASCTTYDNALPAGTYCLLKNGDACGSTDGFCTSQFCNGGSCQKCTVCADTALCPNASIGDAITAATAGDVIGIAAGTYDTYAEITTDNLTLRRCGADDAGSVTWVNDDDDPGPTLGMEETGITAITVKDIDFYGGRSLIIYGKGTSNTRLTVTAEGCTFTGRYDQNTDFYFGAIAMDSYSDLNLTSCVFDKFVNEDDSGGALQIEGAGPGTDRNINTFTDVTITNCSSTNYMAGGADLRSSDSTLTRCTFTGNSGLSGGGLYLSNGGVTTLIDCTISGNTATSTSANDGLGGGVVVDNNAQTGANIATLGIQGTTTITGNTASGSNASNGGGVASIGGGIVNGGSTTNISGNSPTGEDCTTENSGTYTTVSCATWT